MNTCASCKHYRYENTSFGVEHGCAKGAHTRYDTNYITGRVTQVTEGMRSCAVVRGALAECPYWLQKPSLLRKILS
jgi:hypothetical protein